MVGVGGTATNDGGAGLLAALGVGSSGRSSARGGLALADIDAGALAGLADARQRLTGIELVLAGATDVALLGFHGTSATYAEGKGATPEQAQALEAALGHYADLAAGSLVAGRPLLGKGPAAAPGSGAGGGLGFALLLLGATYQDGVGGRGRGDRAAGPDRRAATWSSQRRRPSTGVRCAVGPSPAWPLSG